MSSHQRTALVYDVSQQANLLIVEITIGNFCNYTCSYCPSILHDNSLGFHKIDDVMRFAAAVRAHWPTQRICWRITGGEPTVYESLTKMLDHNRALGMFNSIMSNGSRNLRFWDRIIDKLDFMFISFHPERASAEHFDAVMRHINGRIPISIQVMMLPTHFEKSLAAVKLFKTAQYPNSLLSMKKLRWQFGDDWVDYTPEQLAEFDEHTTEIGGEHWLDVHRGYMHYEMRDGSNIALEFNRLSPDWFNFDGWICDAGLHNIMVNVHGDIYRGQCLQGGKIGSIRDATYQFPTAPVTCAKSSCMCLTDLFISKRLNS